MAELHFTSNGSGQPLVVLHGLFGSGKNWQTHARQFASRYRVVTIDLRNHGDSFHADEMNYPVMANDVEALLRQLDIDKCYILGHSMGGKVAMALALQNTDLFAAMIVADIAPVAYFHHYDDLIDPILALRLDRLESRAEADQLLRQNIPEDQLRAFLLQNLIRESSGWRWRVNWQVIQRDIEWLTGFIDLPADEVIEVPTLFLRGEKSDYIGDAEIEVINRIFSKPSITTIEDAGHWLHAENPDAFSSAVLDFLQLN
ncbi:MAG: alpha/beta fold hydrolase [Gammaproteobacteria bacterium]|nr:alpha/beta fold hydrolase [Gammaproteobacteria bacterium]MDH3857134.1 alpha/beta fold hydrolase [Gammaproteobacteria bacterium]